LDPNINKAPFSEEEDNIILDLRAKENGWAEIAKSLSNRTSKSVKNRWSVMETKRKRKRREEVRMMVKGQKG
jgi:hypothetical protein